MGEKSKEQREKQAKHEDAKLDADVFYNIGIKMSFIRLPRNVKGWTKNLMLKSHNLERNGSSKREMWCNTDIGYLP